MKIIVIGGSGLIGSKLCKKLAERSHQVVPASPKSGVNTVTGEGLVDAITSAEVVVDVSNSPSWEDAAVMKFFKKKITQFKGKFSCQILKQKKTNQSICDLFSVQLVNK